MINLVMKAITKVFIQYLGNIFWANINYNSLKKTVKGK